MGYRHSRYFFYLVHLLPLTVTPTRNRCNFSFFRRKPFLDWYTIRLLSGKVRLVSRLRLWDSTPSQSLLSYLVRKFSLRPGPVSVTIVNRPEHFQWIDTSYITVPFVFSLFGDFFDDTVGSTLYCHRTHSEHCHLRQMSSTQTLYKTFILIISTTTFPVLSVPFVSEVSNDIFLYT